MAYSNSDGEKKRSLVKGYCGWGGRADDSTRGRDTEGTRQGTAEGVSDQTWPVQTISLRQPKHS